MATITGPLDSSVFMLNLRELHWVFIGQLIQFQIACLCYRLIFENQFLTKSSASKYYQAYCECICAICSSVRIDRTLALCFCFSCIKLNQIFSNCFAVMCGVRQGSVLPPFCLLFVQIIFSQFSLLVLIQLSIINCSIIQSFNAPFIVLYADDILSIDPSIRRLLRSCEHELNWLDIPINVKESCCTKFVSVITNTGHKLP